jgi:drug/metabolite transporter (DMT)-like permease
MTFSAGDLFLLGTVLSGALGYTFSGRLAALMPGWEVISWQVVIFLPLAAAATFVLWPADIATASISSWIGLGYVGLVSQYTSFFVFNAGLAIGGIARVGQVMLLQPFMIVALALPVNGEAIDIETILFTAAVVATVLIGQRMRVTRHNRGKHDNHQHYSNADARSAKLIFIFAQDRPQNVGVIVCPGGHLGFDPMPTWARRQVV